MAPEYSEEAAIMAAEEAISLVDAFIAKHGPPYAIPTLMGAVLTWAVERGASENMRRQLALSAAKLDEVEAEFRSTRQ